MEYNLKTVVKVMNSKTLQTNGNQLSGYCQALNLFVQIYKTHLPRRMLPK